MSGFQAEPYDDGGHHFRERFFDDVDSSHRSRTGLATLALAVAVFLLVAAVSVRQVTAPGPARNILESGIASTTEIDQVIAEDHDALRQLVENSSATSFNIPDYPVDVSLTRDEILKSSDAELRQMVLERSSGLVYSSGLDAFDRTGQQSFSRFSSHGALEFAVGQVSASNHDRANLLTVGFLVVAAAAACMVLLAGHGWGRLRALGLGTLLGAVPGVALAGLLWLAVDGIGGNDRFTSDLRGLLRSTIEVPLRNYLAVFALGAALTALGILFGVAERRAVAVED